MSNQDAGPGRNTDCTVSSVIQAGTFWPAIPRGCASVDLTMFCMCNACPSRFHCQMLMHYRELNYMHVRIAIQFVRMFSSVMYMLTLSRRFVDRLSPETST